MLIDKSTKTIRITGNKQLLTSNNSTPSEIKYEIVGNEVHIKMNKFDPNIAKQILKEIQSMNWFGNSKLLLG